MKNYAKIIALFFVLIMSAALLFAGCSPAEEPQTSESLNESLPEQSTSADTEPPVETPTEFSIVSSGTGNFKIVRPAEIGPEEMPVKVAIDIRKTVMDLTDVSLALGDDWKKDDAQYDSNSYEILVGNTEYPETAEVMNSIGYGQYAVKAVGNKIVVFSYTNSGYTSALGKFVSLMRNNQKTEDDGTKSITVSLEDINIIGVAEEMTATLPIYQGGTLSAVADMGDGCYGVIIAKTNPDEYNAYLDVLAEKGYKTYATNEIVGSYFSTLYTDTYTVNAGYYNGLGEARIIIEPYAEDTLAPKKNDDAPKVTTTQVTMIGVEGIYNGDYQQNGMCLIYRLSDGSFVIIDGGHHGNSSIYAANIIKALREQSKDYAKTDKDITIASWIITHPHTDHHGTLLNEYKQFTKFNFKSIMCNFWGESDFNLAKNTTSSFATGSFSAYYKCYSIAKEIKVDFITPHVGQVFWYGDTAFEFLYTIESYLPKVATGFNTSSLVFRTITSDASGKTTSVMVTGDATGHALAVCTRMYGSDLKCDVVQVAHHGGGTGGANKQTQDAYTLMKPSVVLWPIGQNNFAGVHKNTYNHALLEPQNTNFAELYVAGWQGNSVTLPLPYTVGAAIVNEVLEPKGN